ncbi:MAG: chromate transporter [Clostridium sp.]|uniref:chromate transporter n=1 Tax=Clostridium sp. TaxID=1506 RepID=UPI003D6CE275
MLKLFLIFIKVGLFSFGGGYAMIPLLTREIQTNNWMPISEFMNVIGIAEMTPGPIAVNSATFIGYKMYGIIGGAIATLGVALPSLIIVLLISRVLFKDSNRTSNKVLFYGMRPVVAALIICAALDVSKTCFFNGDIKLENINLWSVGIFIIIFVSSLKFKIHPILLILISALMGTGLYYVKII